MDVQNELDLLLQLRNIWIGTHKLRVARASTRANVTSTRLRRHKLSLDKQRNPDTGDNRAHREQRKVDIGKFRTQKSYAEALRHETSSHSKMEEQPSKVDSKTSLAKMVFIVPDEEIQWLKDCYVGETYAEEQIPVL
ncbi:hypothetical protein Ancab_001852 [Ancistrocladus abbreviatus]